MSVHDDILKKPYQPLKVSLEGITLEMMVTRLVEVYGWKELGAQIKIRCFTNDPSVKSSLTFLRKTPWARKKVEDLFVKFRRAQMKKQLKIEAKAEPPAKPRAKSLPLPALPPGKSRQPA